jgi:sterol carrier protein 2
MQAPGLFDIQDKRGKFGLVHNVGLGGAVVVSLLRRPEFYKPGGKDGRSRYDFPFFAWILFKFRLYFRLGYNHAHECRPVTLNDVNKVKSKSASPYVLQYAKL